MDFQAGLNLYALAAFIFLMRMGSKMSDNDVKIAPPADQS
jgi:hypothetical protein